MCITPGSTQIIWVADGTAGRFYKFDLNGNTLGAFGKEGKWRDSLAGRTASPAPTKIPSTQSEELNYRVQKLEVQSSR